MDRYSIESLLLRSSCSRIAPLLTPDVRNKSTPPTYPSPMLFQQVHYSALDTKMLCYTAFRLRLAKDRLMPEFTPEAQERAKAWLREQVKPEDDRKGVSTYTIRDILKRYTKKGPSQSTVARAVQALEDDEDLEKTMMRAIMALFVSEEAEAKRITDAKAAAPQPASDVEGDAASAQRAEAQPTEPTVYEQWNERQEKLVHAQLRAVIARQFERGLVPETDVAEGIVSGDGVYYLHNLEPFNYQDEGAEAVGFLDKGDMLPDGRAAAFYTKGVSRYQRRQKWALPDGDSRNQLIGKRLANLVTVIPYYDDSWFWGLLMKMIDSWRALLQRFETWITDGVPPMPSRQDAEAYEELLRQTALFHYKKIAYEGPAPDVTHETLKRDIGVLWLRVRRREDSAKAKGWVVRLVCLGLLGIIHSWVLLSAAPGLISLRETVEGWRTTGWQPGAELLLLLASPRALTDALVVLTLLFLISGFYARKRVYWLRKGRFRLTLALGTLVVLVAVSLMPSQVAFETLPGLERVVASSQTINASSR